MGLGCVMLFVTRLTSSFIIYVAEDLWQISETLLQIARYQLSPAAPPPLYAQSKNGYVEVGSLLDGTLVTSGAVTSVLNGARRKGDWSKRYTP